MGGQPEVIEDKLTFPVIPIENVGFEVGGWPRGGWKDKDTSITGTASQYT